MSWFGKKEEPPALPNFQQGGLTEEQKLNVRAAIFELKATSSMFNQMVSSCFNKCVVKYREPELELGENTCIDRCVAKFMETASIVGPQLMKESQAEAEMMAKQMA